MACDQWSIPAVVALVTRYERYRRDGYHLRSATTGERGAYTLVRAALIRAWREA